MTLSKKWVVMKVVDKASKYGSYIKEITFANADFEIAHSYLDENNNNYARWRDIVDLHDYGYGVIVEGLKIKRTGKHKSTGEPLVNADSPVKIFTTADRQQLLAGLEIALMDEQPKEQLFAK